jgi:hypothetical protein
LGVSRNQCIDNGAFALGQGTQYECAIGL